MSKVEWEKEALDDLQKTDTPVVKRILNKITWPSQHFDNIIPETLAGDMSGLFKLRIGDWRVVYEIENRGYASENEWFLVHERLLLWRGFNDWRLVDGSNIYCEHSLRENDAS